MYHRFYEKTVAQRRECLDFEGMETLAGALTDETAVLNTMSENVIGSWRLPLGVLTSICVDGREHRIAMATEEPSVVAAANRASALINLSGGVFTAADKPVTRAQIMLVCEESRFEWLKSEVLSRQFRYLSSVNEGHSHLIANGGGAFALDVTKICDDRIAMADGRKAIFAVIWLSVHTADAMGANLVNTMAEAMMNCIVDDYGDCLDPGMAILTNDGAGRIASAEVHIPHEILAERARCDGKSLARRIEMASVFAEKSPERAITHNKGILNGMIACALPLGQDTRALEAAAFDWACRSGRHLPLCRWWNDCAQLTGKIELPLTVGFAGAFRTLPQVSAAFQFDGIASYHELCGVLASVGLAQNLAALWALVTTGIQAGHLKLHARKMNCSDDNVPTRWR
ncbi:MAG: 3-hydroxy-3-methylglutaryl-CoA reductase [Proteobacteria bacterium]|nr:3-hydroxy-3-methylglutaryl-CoA reductase [Pseudomonadota bacterium]